MPSKLPDDVNLAFDDDELLHALAGGDLTPARDFLAATRDQPYRRELALDAFAYAGSPVLPKLIAAAENDPDNAPPATARQRTGRGRLAGARRTPPTTSGPG
jgi:hypothetical protein